MATITLEVVHFRAHLPFPALLPFLKCILEVVFCFMLSTVCDSASITSVVSKWRPFSFIFNWGKSTVGGRRQAYCFGKKIPGEKEV
jgi:hypothetical protein